jgi:hypothetical protein
VITDGFSGVCVLSSGSWFARPLQDGWAVSLKCAEIDWYVVEEYTLAMTVADLAKLSLREKLQLLEAIWEDLRFLMDAMKVPREHRQILDDRRERIDSGEAKLLDWDQVKHSLA